MRGLILVSVMEAGLALGLEGSAHGIKPYANTEFKKKKKRPRHRYNLHASIELKKQKKEGHRAWKDDGRLCMYVWTLCMYSMYVLPGLA